MSYPDPSFGQQPRQPAGQEGGYGQPPAGYGAGQPQQFQGQPFPGQQFSGQQLPQGQSYPPHSPSPLASVGIGTWLAIGVAAASLLAWLLSLFANETVAVDYSLAGGVLALVVLLPSTEKLKVPNVVPFVGVLSVLGGLMVIRQATLVGIGSPDALAVVVLVLLLLQMIIAAVAVLMHYGLLKSSGPSAPRQPIQQGQNPPQQWTPAQQPYGAPSAGNPSTGAAPSTGATPSSGATPSGGAPSGGAQAGHFDPAQFGAAPQAPQSATKQFNRPSDPPRGFSG